MDCQIIEYGNLNSGTMMRCAVVDARQPFGSEFVGLFAAIVSSVSSLLTAVLIVSHCKRPTFRSQF